MGEGTSLFNPDKGDFLTTHVTYYIEMVSINYFVHFTIISLSFYVSVDTEDCDIVVRSDEHGTARNGTFHSPGWPKNYGHNLRCVYKFIAKPTERVKIRFSSFNVKGHTPRYVQISKNIRDVCLFSSVSFSNAQNIFFI